MCNGHTTNAQKKNEYEYRIYNNICCISPLKQNNEEIVNTCIGSKRKSSSKNSFTFYLVLDK